MCAKCCSSFLHQRKSLKVLMEMTRSKFTFRLFPIPHFRHVIRGRKRNNKQIPCSERWKVFKQNRKVLQETFSFLTRFRLFVCLRDEMKKLQHLSLLLFTQQCEMKSFAFSFAMIFVQRVSWDDCLWF